MRANTHKTKYRGDVALANSSYHFVYYSPFKNIAFAKQIENQINDRYLDGGLYETWFDPA